MKKLLKIIVIICVHSLFSVDCRMPYYEARGYVSVRLPNQTPVFSVNWSGPGFSHKYGAEITFLNKRLTCPGYWKPYYRIETIR